MFSSVVWLWSKKCTTWWPFFRPIFAVTTNVIPLYLGNLPTDSESLTVVPRLPIGRTTVARNQVACFLAPKSYYWGLALLPTLFALRRSSHPFVGNDTWIRRGGTRCVPDKAAEAASTPKWRRILNLPAIIVISLVFRYLSICNDRKPMCEYCHPTFISCYPCKYECLW